MPRTCDGTETPVTKLTEADATLTLRNRCSQPLIHIEPATFQLRGKKEDEQILEGRIPNPIEYPFTSKDDVPKIITRHYLFDNQEIFRLAGVETL